MDKALVNPIEDQRKEALRHYDEAARLANHWSSFVRDAILAYNPTTMDKQDKTAEDLFEKSLRLLKEHLDNTSKEDLEKCLREVKSVGIEGPTVDEYFESLSGNHNIIAKLEAKIKELEERLEAADEVIQASRSIKLYATHGLIAEDYNKALEKYNSLKLKK